MALTPDELARYRRHTVIPEVGLEGQEKLKRARVLAVGAGGLGSPFSLYLAAAGVGTLGLVDHDEVDESNLQRQVLYSTGSVGRPKLAEARARLEGLNPHVKIETHSMRLSAANALEVVRGYDIVADGTDNFPARYLVNDACVLAGKPNVYGSVFRFEGQVAVFDAKRGPCYRCLYPEPPPPASSPSCAEAGVFGVLPGIIGCLQAAETIKLILGVGEPLIGRWMLFDALEMEWRTLKFRKDPRCPICGENPSIRELQDCGAACAQAEPGVGEISPEQLKARLDRGGPLVLLDVREPHEHRRAHLPGCKLIPLGELSRRLGELDRSQELVVYCQMGGRSAKAAALLAGQGFEKVLNLKGGLQAWSERGWPT